MYTITITIHCNMRRYDSRLFRFHHLEVIVVGVRFPNSRTLWLWYAFFSMDERRSFGLMKGLLKDRAKHVTRPCMTHPRRKSHSPGTRGTSARHCATPYFYPLHRRQISYRQTTNKGNGTPSHGAYLIIGMGLM